MESPVDAHLTGVGGCIGVTGAIVGIGVSWRVGLDVDEGFLGARRGVGGFRAESQVRGSYNYR